RVVGRQTQGVLEQVRAFAEAVRDALEALLGVLEYPTTHVHTELMEQVDTILDRLVVFDRSADGSAADTGELRSRIERLEAIEARREFHPWFSNDRFEAVFRGTAEELRKQYEDLARGFAGNGPVLDIGCGRGEFLELLGDLGVQGIGVEIDPELVAWQPS